MRVLTKGIISDLRFMTAHEFRKYVLGLRKEFQTVQIEDRLEYWVVTIS